MARTRVTPRAFALISLVCALCLMAPGSALAISRKTVIARAKVWVNAAVPYSQSRHATEPGKLLPKTTTTYNASLYGFRTDCSGFASMCLNLRKKGGLPNSLDTGSLDDVMFRIPKASLRPGDIILRPNNLIIDGEKVGYGHAVVFGGWVDSSQTRYYGYHESSSAGCAVRRIVHWGTSGFWSEKGFAPYRCAVVRDRAKIGVGAGQ